MQVLVVGNRYCWWAWPFNKARCNNLVNKTKLMLYQLLMLWQKTFSMLYSYKRAVIKVGVVRNEALAAQRAFQHIKDF